MVTAYIICFNLKDIAFFLRSVFLCLCKILSINALWGLDPQVAVEVITVNPQCRTVSPYLPPMLGFRYTHRY
jgi:hypothetical protein